MQPEMSSSDFVLPIIIHSHKAKNVSISGVLPFSTREIVEGLTLPISLAVSLNPRFPRLLRTKYLQQIQF